MKNLAFIAILFLFCACSPKNPQNLLKNELLAYTQKTQIISQNEQILAIGSYLNPIYSELNDDFNDHIILAVYPKTIAINFNSFTLNGQKISPKLLKNDDELIKKLAFYVPLAHYFEISAPKQDTIKLTLRFFVNQNDEVFLSFQKVSKSMYWNPKRLNIPHN